MPLRLPMASMGMMNQRSRSEEHTSELQSQSNLVCRLLLEKKKNRVYKNQARNIYLQTCLETPARHHSPFPCLSSRPIWRCNSIPLTSHHDIHRTVLAARCEVV